MNDNPGTPTLNTMERPLSTDTKSTTALHDPPVPVRAKLAAAWTWPRTTSPSMPEPAVVPSNGHVASKV